MAISIGSRTIVTKLSPGVYPATIKYIQESKDVEMKNGGILPAVDIEYELELGSSFLIKEKKYIASDKKGSELRELIDELLPQTNFEKGIDLNNLIGKRCKVEIIENISSKGNRFANISTVKAVDVGE